MSFIIDDSTCLANLAHFCIPQFAEVFPDRYKQDWRKLPREIPDSFVRKFGEWCHERGIKGKYSIVPYPACVGWVPDILMRGIMGEMSCSGCRFWPISRSAGPGHRTGLPEVSYRPGPVRGGVDMMGVRRTPLASAPTGVVP